MKEWFSIHNHSCVSNFRLRDSINKVEDMLDYALKKGLSGLCLTEHEALSNHVKAYKYIKENEEKFKDFTLGFGNEIYLVDKNDVEVARFNNDRITFHHFILIAKNQNGYTALKKLSSRAWENSFYYKGIERTPTYKNYLEEIMKEYKGDLIASTACVGGEVPQILIEYKNNPTLENKMKVHKLINWLKDLFGEDLYFELQPSHNEDQLAANEMLLKIGKAYGIKCIVSTDAHYLSKSQARAHEIYLQASEGDREVAAFYATTYIMSRTELLRFFDLSVLNELIENTNEIKKKIQSISFAQEIKVPIAHIPEFELDKLFIPYYMKYEYIYKYSQSKYEVDRYYLHLIAQGIKEKKEKLNDENLARINTELEELYFITEKLEQPLSSYFVLTKDLVDLMWEVSLVGVSRGSASCFYLNYLLDIVQINPLKYNLPHWRFLSKERIELPDIDLDSESSKRYDIIELTKRHYGKENVLNMGSLTTEGTRSTVLTTCRGLGIDKDISQNISNLIPADKGSVWTLKECFEGDKKKNKKPATAFIQEVEKYEGLKEAMLAIEGIVSGRGQHASGVIIFPNGYIAQNAMMKTTSGLEVTQFDAKDSEYMGGLKYDFLSINALDRIRAAMELLIEYKKIEWQGTLRATYNKYFHPDVLEFDAPDMYQLLFNGDVLNAFQFETPVGQQALTKINARSFDELCAGNSLMRLSCEGEQPLDKFVRFKNDIRLWYKEMDDEGLDANEQEVLKRHLTDRYGVCDTQEGLMLLSMDQKIAGFSLTQANKFRKAVAKQNQKLIEEQRVIFYEHGLEIGTRQTFLDYVWNKLLKPQFGYAFSLPHIAGYTLILMIEMNICYRFGSIFWKTACLSVNAGLTGDNAGGTNYGAIAKAVGDMKGIIKNPDINLSGLGFTPREDKNEILFGLKPISGLGVDAIQTIIESRPYYSFNDFLEKMNMTQEKIDKYDEIFKQMVKTGKLYGEDEAEKLRPELESYKSKLSNSKVVTLIKAGCFDSLDRYRRQVMIDFVKRITPKRDKLTMVQLPVVIHLVDKEKYKKELEVYEFRNKIQGRKKIEMNKELEKEFIQKYSKDVNYEFENGKLKIDEKSFSKYYNTAIEGLKEWLTSYETAQEFNKIKMQEFWTNNCKGTIQAWEMETILFYSDFHELDFMPISSTFNIADFTKLPTEPVITGYKSYRGRSIPQFKIDTIAGTVVEKVKGKSLVYLLTQSGVVTIKYNKGQFAHYDTKIVRINGKDKVVLDESWFARGTKLVVVGYRRNEEFVLRTAGSAFNHTTFKINGYNQERLYLQNEKVEG